MGLVKKIVGKLPRDFSIVTIFSLGSKLIQAVLTVVVIRVLTVEDYASYTVFLTLSGTILGVAGQSFSLAYVRYNTEKISLDPRAADTVFLISHAVNCASCALAGAVVAIGGEGFGYAPYLLLLAVLYGFILGAIQIDIAFLQSRERYAAAGVVENCKQGAILLLVIGAVVAFGATVDSILLAYLLSGVLCLAISMGYFWQPIRTGSLRFVLDRSEARNFIAVSFWLILYSAVMQTFNQVDVSMLTAFRMTEQVAEYGVALKYYNIILVLLPSIKTVLRVRMSKAEMTTSVVRQREFALRWMRKATVPFLIGVGLLCVGAQFLFPILNGVVYDRAIFVFDILCVSAFFAYVLAPSVSLVMSLGRYREQFLLALLALAVNTAGNWLLIPGWGAVGVAISTTVSQFILNASMTFLVFWHARKADVATEDERERLD